MNSRQRNKSEILRSSQKAEGIPRAFYKKEIEKEALKKKKEIEGQLKTKT